MTRDRLFTGDQDPVLLLQQRLEERRPTSTPDHATRRVVVEIVADLPNLRRRPKALLDYASFTFGMQLEEAMVRGALAELEA